MLKNINKKNLSYYGAASVLPNIFLLFLYAQNLEENFIRFQHVLILVGAFLLVGIIAFLVFKLVVKSSEAALLLCIVSWVLFWFFGSIFSLLPTNRPITLGIVLILISGIAILLRFLKVTFEKLDFVFSSVAVVVCLMFVFNLANALRLGGGLDLSAVQGEGEYVKREFNIDKSLPNPDIYWLWVDGMLSFATVERFFEDPQDDLRQELVSRGFVIKDDAMLHAGLSWVALPALFSPYFYDNYFGRLLQETNHLTTSFERSRSGVLSSNIRQDIGIFEIHIAPYLELHHALAAAGYTLIQQSSPTTGFTPFTSHYFYNIGSSEVLLGRNPELQSVSSPFLAGFENLMDLIFATTPLYMARHAIWRLLPDVNWEPTPSHGHLVEPLLVTHPHTEALVKERMHLNSLIDSFAIPSPKFVLSTPSFTHRLAWSSLVQGHPEILNPLAEYAYINAHKYAVRMMLTMIDLILEENPYAVIVLQSDHGFHYIEHQRFLYENGMNDYDLFELINSTMSAVRIPARYGGLDEPIAPINISRELINRFAGQNFEMTAPHTNPHQ